VYNVVSIKLHNETVPEGDLRTTGWELPRDTWSHFQAVKHRAFVHELIETSKIQESLLTILTDLQFYIRLSVYMQVYIHTVGIYKYKVWKDVYQSDPLQKLSLGDRIKEFFFFLRQGFTTWLRLASNSWASCLCLQMDVIMILHHHHAQLCVFETKSHSIAQSGLQLVIILPQLPECWDYRCAPLCFV
jgi:hypothetical protein